METGLAAALIACLETRMSAGAARSAFVDALRDAGLTSLPAELLAAQGFVRGPLARLLSVRVGAAVTENWLPALLSALERGGAVALSPPTPPADPWVGRAIAGRYQLLQRVTQGQRGVLYRAERLGDHVRMAVKLVGPAVYQARERFQACFVRECEIAKSLVHPHILTVYDHGWADERLRFVAMEWLSGSDLSQMLAAHGPLNVRQALFVARQVCESLAYAHAQGVVHGDLSPGGIFVARQRATHTIVKVLDYGRQRMASFSDEGSSQVGFPQGWARYLAPEQITNDEFDARADIYAVGAVLYELLSGVRPFPDATGLQILLSQGHGSAPKLGSRVGAGAAIPSQVEELVMRCLEKDAAARFQTMAELEALLSQLAR